jgi:hypothetical protein
MQVEFRSAARGMAGGVELAGSVSRTSQAATSYPRGARSSSGQVGVPY